jgi:hypothetical protein
VKQSESKLRGVFVCWKGLLEGQGECSKGNAVRGMQ